MITYTEMDELFDVIRASMSMVFLREDQRAYKGARPFAVYKILDESVESHHQNVRTVEDAGGAPGSENAKVTLSEKSEAVVSIRVIGSDVADQNTIRTKAEEILNYFRWNDFYTVAAVGLTVLIISPTVEDRTVFVDEDYEYQVGFDIRVVKTKDYEKTIEAVEVVEITPTIDAVEKAKITINL